VNVLRRAVARTQECCEICAVPIDSDRHGHLVDVTNRRLLCACRACFLLFVPRGAAQGGFRAVGERHLRLKPAAFEGPAWEALQIPIGLAFFFFNSATQRIAAFYPGPGGATESSLALDAWDGIVRAEPALADLQPDVEGVLVNRERACEPQAYLVPIDACYELAGIVRSSWEGFEGGVELRARLAQYFKRIEELCPV
jgi:Family of unknown function (DUF5947)